MEPAEWSEPAEQEGSITEEPAGAQSAPKWVQRVDDPTELASAGSEWSDDMIWKEDRAGVAGRIQP